MQKKTYAYKYQIKIGLKNLLIITVIFAVALKIIDVLNLSLSSFDREAKKWESEYIDSSRGESYIISDWPEEYPLLSLDELKEERPVHILVLGDSFVWGTNSTNRNELFWNLLQKKLLRNGYNCKIDAVGFPGYSSYDEFNWITDTDLISDLNPDLIVFNYVINDADPKLLLHNSDLAHKYEDALKGYKTPPGFVVLNEIFPNIMVKLSSIVKYKTLFNEKYGNLFETPDVCILSGIRSQFYEEYFIKPLKNFEKKSGIPVAIMTMPFSDDEKFFRYLHKPLKELCDKHDVTLYDTTDPFFASFVDEKHKKNYFVNPSDCHPGSAINYFYSNYMYQWITEDYSDIIGKSAGYSLYQDELRINDMCPGGSYVKMISDSPDRAVYSVDVSSERLNLPIGEPYIKFSLADPMILSEVEIESENIDEINVYYTYIDDELCYDDHTVKMLERRDDGSFVFKNISGDTISSLCIHIQWDIMEYVSEDGTQAGSFKLKLKR